MTNLEVVFRHESTYGEMFGVALKSMIAAGDTYEETEEYLRARGFCVDALSVA